MSYFFRLIIFGLLFYLAAKLVGALLSPKSRTEVRGRSKSKPLDLSDKDIEDVDYKERDD